MTTSRDSFNHQCYRFLSECHLLSDSWHLSRMNHNDSRQVLIEHDSKPENLGELELMLNKTEIKTSVDGSRVWIQEYSIVYSDSYEVPVMYFNMSNQDGSPVSLQDGLSQSNLLKHSNQLQSIVNQVEHPILFRPFFMIHPCRTRNLMDLHEDHLGDNYLIIWLSSVATLLDLKLPAELGNCLEQ